MGCLGKVNYILFILVSFLIYFCMEKILVIWLFVVVFCCFELKKLVNGYFVNDYCDSVFNVVCGIKCKFGYELWGNSFRIC